MRQRTLREWAWIIRRYYACDPGTLTWQQLQDAQSTLGEAEYLLRPKSLADMQREDVAAKAQTSERKRQDKERAL